MSASTTAAAHVTRAATITHTTIAVRGHVTGDVSVYHARTPDARITVTFGGTMLVFYHCASVQGLLEAFAAARGHSAQIPNEIPAPPADPAASPVRSAVSVEWARRVNYAVMPQAALNKLRTAKVHWVDLYTGPITWQIRDRAALSSVLELMTRVHKTAIAVFRDGEQHAADPTSDDYRAA
jgi:hypothetical protein